MKIVRRVKKKDYVKNNLEPLLFAVRTSGAITNEETVDPKEFSDNLVAS